MNVFIILNEWTDIAGGTSSQIVDAKFFETEHDAWVALCAIAEAYEVPLGRDETSLTLEHHTRGLQYEEWYIQELTRG